MIWWADRGWACGSVEAGESFEAFEAVSDVVEFVGGVGVGEVGAVADEGAEGGAAGVGLAFPVGELVVGDADADVGHGATSVARLSHGWAVGRQGGREVGV